MENGNGDVGVKVIKADRNNIDISALFVTDETERMDLVSKRAHYLHPLFSIKNNHFLSPYQLIMLLRDQQGRISQKYRHFSKNLGCLSSGSVIIYVWRKKDAEYISEQLRSYGDLGKVVCYHAGMSASDRASSQNMVSYPIDNVLFGYSCPKFSAPFT